MGRLEIGVGRLWGGVDAHRGDLPCHYFHGFARAGSLTTKGGKTEEGSMGKAVVRGRRLGKETTKQERARVCHDDKDDTGRLSWNCEPIHFQVQRVFKKGRFPLDWVRGACRMISKR